MWVVLRVVLVLLLCCSTQAVVAQQSLWYAAGGFGKGDFSSGELNGLMNDGSISSFRNDKKSSLYELTLGMRLNQRMYAELGYQDLGSYSSSGTSDGTAVHANQLITGKLKTSLLKVSLLFNLHPRDYYNFYARVGVHKSSVDQSVTGQTSESARGSGLHYGIGYGLILSSAWQLQLEWTRYADISYTNVITDDGHSANIDTIGLRWLYLF